MLPTPAFRCWSPNTRVTVLEIRLWRGDKGLKKLWERSPDLLVLADKKRDRHQSSLPAMEGHKEKATIWKLGRGFSPEPDHAGIFILNFQSPDLWWNKCLWYKPPNLSYFVIAASADSDTNLQEPHGFCGHGIQLHSMGTRNTRCSLPWLPNIQFWG